MGTVLCATRGGEASYRTQEKAIALAKERDDKLLFLYVANLQFLDKTASPIVVNVEEEVQQMGEFLLLMASERAKAHGITPDTLVKQGDFREALVNIATEKQVSLIVLGSPAGDESVFEMDSLKKFAAAIERATGVETIIV